MHVLFVAPHFPSYQRHFVRAMHSVGAKVTGIGEASLGHLDGELKSWMVGYEQVPSVCDEQAMLECALAEAFAPGENVKSAGAHADLPNNQNSDP